MPYCERHYLWFALAALRCVEGYLSAEVNGQQNRKTIPRIRWLLQCSHLMVPLCLVVCPVGARLIAVCGAALCPVPPPPPPCAGTSNILPSNQQVILGRCFQVKNQRSAVYSWFGFCTQT